MAFVAEDGTGIDGANSFATVAFFRAYFLDRGISGTDSGTIDDSTVQTLLVRSTDYIVKRFGTRLRGSRATDTQTLPFPRTGVRIDGAEIPDDEVPEQFQQACVEYALRAKDIVLAPDPPIPFDRTDANGETITGSGIVQRKRERVDVVEEETGFGGGQNGDILQARSRGGTLTAEPWMIPAYPAADLLIEPFLRGTGRVIR